MSVRTLVAAVAAAIGVVTTVVAMQQPAQSESAAQGLVAAQAIANADTGVGRYFTAAQARRGRELYMRHCGYCHYANDGPMPTMSGIRGQQLAPRLLQREANGITRYPSTYYLFKRMEYMPPNDVDSITPQERADILAYLLQQNGLTSGTSELKADDGVMKAMVLPAEPGFVHVFNGRDFSGWQFLFGYHCTPPPEGCGRTDPTGIVSVKDGVMATTGKMHGVIYTTNKYKNFSLRFEQRVPVEWDDLDVLIQDQTGILIFFGSRPGPIRTWGNFIEIEGKYHELLRFGGRNTVVDDEARRRAINPVNQWQQIEIVSKDGTLKNYLNGTLISSGELADDLPPGYIGLQSQGGPVEWRNIRLREE